MPAIIRIALGLSVMSCASAFAQAANGPPAPPPAVTNPTAPEMAQKRQAEAHDRALQNRTRDRARDQSREPGHPAIGPSTTQGLAQDAITRSETR